MVEAQTQSASIPGTAGSNRGIFRLTVLAQPLPHVWYAAWMCAACRAILTLEQLQYQHPNASIRLLTPANALVRITCPRCRADHLYGINDRRMVRVPPSL